MKSPRPDLDIAGAEMLERCRVGLCGGRPRYAEFCERHWRRINSATRIDILRGDEESDWRAQDEERRLCQEDYGD